MANATLIHNPTFVWPNGYVPDADTFGFLSAADSEFNVPDAPDPDDDSILVAAGPLNLAPQEIRVAAFAVLAGEGLEDLLANAERAQEMYLPPSPIGVGQALHPIATQLYPPEPHPYTSRPVIRFDHTCAGSVRLGLYDVRGRLIRTLLCGRQPAGSHSILWDGRDGSGHDLSSGIYFIRLETPGGGFARRMIRLK